MNIREGSAIISGESSSITQDGSASTHTDAFYNNVQVVNRDLSILVVQTYIDSICSEKIKHEGIQVCEALGASGLRSIRYHQEIEGIQRIICNDKSSAAVEIMKSNFRLNNIPKDSVKPSCADANELMSRLARSKNDPIIVHLPPKTPLHSPDFTQAEVPEQAETINVIDIDPYGSAVPFLNSAIECITDGGLLCVTCTDSAVLCGKYPDTCHAKYGSISLRNRPFNHEMGLRILLASIERTANAQGRYIEPLLSAKIDFYFRVFVVIRKKASKVKQSCAKFSHILQCTQCSHFQLLPVASARGNLLSKKSPKSEASPNVNSDSESCMMSSYLVCQEMPPVSNFSVTTPRLTRKSILGWSELIKENVEISCETESEPWCPSCQSENYTVGGPVYNQAVCSTSFLKSCMEKLALVKTDEQNSPKKMILGAVDRVEALLINLSQELPNVPLYHSIPQLCSDLGKSVPPMPKIVKMIHSLGFQSSRSHCNVYGIKTNCPSFLLYAIIKTIVDQNQTLSGVNDSSEKRKLPIITTGCLKSTVSATIMSETDAEPKGQKIVRFLPNPEPHWGPKSKK